MKSSETKSNKISKHVVSIILSLIIPIGASFFIMLPTYFLDYSPLSTFTKIIVISSIALAIITIPCYFICRQNPGSVWYVPLLVTLSTLWVISGFLSNYWSITAKMTLLVVALVLATAFSILGSIRGNNTVPN